MQRIVRAVRSAFSRRSFYALAGPVALGMSLHQWHVLHVEHEAHLAAESSYSRSYTPPPPARSGGYQTDSYEGSGGMQACIIRAESGGNPYIWNATGHWGLYQFSYGTWVAHGGSPADFGHAGVAEQNQVYYNTVAADGYSDWAPYDGC